MVIDLSKMNKQRSITKIFEATIAMMLSLAIVAILLVHMNDAREQQAMEKNLLDGQMIQLFHVARDEGGYHDISESVSRYMGECCRTLDSATKLLKRNGFDVIVSSEQSQVYSLNRRYDQARATWPISQQVEFDTFVSANRRAGFARFWSVWAEYQVTVFVKSNEVVKVIATVETSL